MHSNEGSDGRSLTLRLSGAQTAALLFFVFNLAFIFTPYWRTLPAPAQGAAALALSIPLGMLWARSAGGAIRVRVSLREAGAFAVLLLACGLPSLRALTADVPWHGDEDFHVMATLPLAEHLRPYLLLVLGASAAYVLFATVVFRRREWLSLAAMAALGLAALVPNPLFEYSRYDPLRYPYVSRYAAALPVSIATFFVTPVPEIAYRVLPFVSAVLVGFLVARRAAEHAPVLRLLIGLFVFTTPLLLYYSSILYLELPAVFLMTVAAFHAECLLTDDVAHVRDNPGWVALALVGFVKETTLPFVAAFLACRLAIQAGRAMRGSSAWPRVVREVRTAFVLALPLGMFLFYRAQRANQRVPSLARHNLIDPEVYLVFARGYAEQFGAVLLLAAAGVLVLAVRRRRATLLFLASAYACDTALHALDYKEYAGYSRFNLFVIPLVAVAVAAVFERLQARSARVAFAVAVAGVAANVVMAPVNVDGTKVPLWGNYLVDTSEHYYPYKRAERWIREQGMADRRIRFTGMPDPYTMIGFMPPFAHQDEKLVPLTGDEGQTIESSLREAAREGVDLVVYHVVGAKVPAVSDRSGFAPGVVIESQAHALILYRRAA